jgi:hypothetical protein
MCGARAAVIYAGHAADRRAAAMLRKLPLELEHAKDRNRPEAEVSESIRLPSVLPKRHRFAGG